MAFLILFLVPCLIGGTGFYFLKTVTWKELLVQLGVSAVVAGISAFVIYHSAVDATEILNGVVSAKTRNVVSCSHSYSCNCHESCSGSGKNRTCSQVCSTCYEHSFDVDWNVHVSYGDVIEIDRVDSQGVIQPERWTSTKIGEPVSRPHSYTNYIKAAPGTLFRHQGQLDKYKGSVPAYPDKVYDYWHLNRLVSKDVPVNDPAKWHTLLSESNGQIGSSSQVNMIVVLTKKPADFYYALEESWIGGNKNDAILVIGVDGSLKPVWANVMAWTTNELFKVKLRDDIMALPVLTAEDVVTTFKVNVAKYYKRKPMRDFEYLKASITPTPSQWAVSLFICILVSLGLTRFMHTNDLFDEESNRYYTMSRHKKGRYS